MRSARPIVAIVGRPNVGKSTLFNRLVGRPRSIVHDEPGVTRDRIYADVTLRGQLEDREAILVDTGGFDPQSEDPIMRRVLEQTQLAIDEADVVVFMTDGRAGLLPEDEEIARVLRKGGKRVFIAANKLDDNKLELLAHEFERLGLARVLPLSAAHGVYTRDLEELIVEALPPLPESERQTHKKASKRARRDHDGDEESTEAEIEVEEEPAGPVRIAVIGRPNVGKSSLINRLIGEDRHLVSEIPGTTRDAVDSLIRRDGHDYLLIDTAGIRKKSSIALRVERFSVVAALRGLERSDVALLMLDPKQGLSDQDAKISAFAYERLKAVILVISKWDLMKGEQSEKDYLQHVRRELAHLSYAPVVFTSSMTGVGIDRLFPVIHRVHGEYGNRIPTGELNRFAEQMMERHPPPSKKGRAGRIYYMTQIGTRPPRFLVSVNDPELIHFSYRRYLLNELRDRYGFGGVPLLVGYRAHKRKSMAERPRPRKKVERRRRT